MPQGEREVRFPGTPHPAHKTPRIPFNPDDLTPGWGLKAIDMDGDWGFASMTAQAFRNLVERLKAFETMTWHEIQGNKQNHPMPVEHISSPAKRRLNEIGKHQLDSLFSLRITGRCRVWGIKEGQMLRLLWWDPDHTVYPVDKKHT